MNEQHTVATPDFRAAIVGNQVSIVEWDPRLNCTSNLAKSPNGGAKYVDLRFLGEHGDHDVLVTHDTPDGIDLHMREVLCSWAELVGHRRIWFTKDVIELARPLPEARRAFTACGSCGISVSAEGLDFWTRVRGFGTFPNRCAACGGILPQWSLTDEMAPKELGS